MSEIVQGEISSPGVDNTTAAQDLELLRAIESAESYLHKMMCGQLKPRNLKEHLLENVVSLINQRFDVNKQENKNV